MAQKERLDSLNATQKKTRSLQSTASEKLSKTAKHSQNMVLDCETNGTSQKA